MADATNVEEPLQFPDEPTDAVSEPAGPPWTVLIVDDDEQVHAATRMALASTMFDGRPVAFLSAHSGAEARALLDGSPDIAVILLDVVMETDDAGLRLVRYIRDELGNHLCRIILRTGQPGQAPERNVILSYDIDDYKAKSELTAQKLFTATIAALRSHKRLAAIDEHRRGLERILEATGVLFERTTLPGFADTVIEAVGLLVGPLDGVALCAARPAAAGAWVLAGSGAFSDGTGRPLREVAPPDLCSEVEGMLAGGQAAPRHANHSVVPVRSREGRDSALVLLGHRLLGDTDRDLIELLSRKIALCLDTASACERLRNAERATVHALGKLAEYKDEATGDHVRRIGRLATAIARELRARQAFPDQIDEAFCAAIGLASMLHDVGKVGIPDGILRKPGALDPAEQTVMRSHAAMGARILREAAVMAGGRGYLSLGAEIAESHHEKFDGTGYPHGLSGDAIPLSGRIVAVADVFDALVHIRPYKKAWAHGDVLDLIRREAGRHFDPRVVDAFLSIAARDGGTDQAR